MTVPNVRRRIFATLRVAATVLVTTCGLDQLTGGSKALDIALSTDTVVVVGATKQLAPSAVDGTPLGGVHVTWASSNPAVVSVDGSGVVTGVSEGSVSVTATLTAPELPPEGISASRRVLVVYGGLVISPIDSLTGLGQSVVPTVRGLDVFNAPVANAAAVLTTSDATIVAVVGNALVARKNGTATITASYAGNTAQTTVKVRQVAKGVFFSSSPFIFRSLGRDTSVTATVVDTRDSVMAVVPTWSSLNAAVATVTPAGVMRALQVAPTTMRVTVDTVTASLPVSVTQAAATLNKSAGDGQTQTAGAALGTLPTLNVKDAGGFAIAGLQVTFSVASGGGAITGAVQTTDANGNATVGSWTLGTTAGGNSLLASAGSLSATFGATGAAGAAVKLAIQQTPSGANAVGTPLAPALQVTIRDVNNNLVTTATTSVTVAFGANPGSATLGGTATVSAQAGVAIFSNLTISAPAAAYTLAATATGLTGVTTSAFTVFGPATKLAFSVQPANVTAGAAIAPGIQVAVQDVAGNTITSATASISLAIGTNPGTGTLAGGGPNAAANGVATFAASSINKSGTGYTLTATASGLTAATSTAFNVTAGAASKLVFLTQPSNTGPSTAITPAVQVAITDALGNTVTSASNLIGMALGAGSPAGTLSGTGYGGAQGVGTFAGLQINLIGNGYTLVASATGLTPATSAAFNIQGPGTASQLRFVTQPSSAVAGVANSPSITVKVVDSVGTTVNTSTASITLAISAITNNGGTLSGTLTANASGGVATFNNVKLDRAATGYKLVASATSLNPDTSSAFTINVGTASALVFTVQPSSTPATQAIAPAVQVSVVDNQGNVVPAATNQITLAFGSNPGSATLGGTLQAAAVSGTATFANLTIANASNGYTLTAAATGFATVTSAAFNVTSGSAMQLRFATQPSSAVAGVANSPAITVKIVDSVGVTVTASTAAVSLTFGNNPGGGGTLSGTVTANAVSGVATFSNVRINRASAGYTLAASATGLAPDTSAAFTINAGAASALVFTQQPTSVVAGGAFSPGVQVSVQDGQGNTVASATNLITVAIANNPGTSTLGGTAQVAAVAGVASFAGLTLNKTASNYTLGATASGLSGTTSATFSVTPGAPATLVITTQPVAVAVGAVMSTVAVTVRDASGNTVTSATTPISLAVLNNPVGAALGGTATVNAVNGVASFTTLTLDKPGQAFTLEATASGLTPATTNAFNAIGPATQLVFTAQPTATIRNGTINPAVSVEARDAAGTKVTSFNVQIAMTIGTNPGSATLNGSTSVTAASGTATFSNLQVSAAGTGYTLVASATGLIATSSTFDITSFGPASKLAFSAQPSNADAGAVISPSVQVMVQDAQGNLVTSSTASVSLALGNPGSATLGGTTPVNATGGIATFSDLTVSAQGSSYTLVASSSLLAPATSSSFVVTTPGAAQRLRFDSQPSNTTAGQFFFPAIVVSAVNSSNTIVTSATGSVTLSVDSGPPGATLGSQASLVSGSATFSSSQLTVAGVYRLRASVANLTSTVSQTFTISPSVANKLAFTSQPTNTTAGRVLPQVVVVEVQDQFGNRIPAAGNQIRVQIQTVPYLCNSCVEPFPIHGAGVAMDGDTIENAQSGVATFAALRPRSDGDLGLPYRNNSSPATGYPMIMQATSAGLTGVNSSAFSVAHAPPVRVAVASQPSQSGQPSLTVIGRQPISTIFAVVDSLGNLAAAGNEVVTVSLSTFPAGAHLAGTTGAVATAATPGTCCSSGFASPSPAVDSLGTYVLTASSSGLTSVNTSPFNAVASAAAQLGFVVLPTSATVGAVIAPAVRVCVLDPYGNEVHSSSGSVVMTIGTNPGSATLGGTLTRALVSGCANFTDLNVSAVGNGYTLRVTASAIVGVSGAFASPLPGFNITP